MSLYVERGLSRGLTLQGKLAWSRGEDAGAAYDGRGPVEVGLRYTVAQGEDWTVAAYAGVVVSGEGRNVGYAPPGEGGTDVEARVLAGWSRQAFDRPAFAEIQVARLARAEMPDETRVDVTLGARPAPEWLLLGQVYAGWTDAEPSWIKLEGTVVHEFGDWSLQAGWRTSVAGKAGPSEAGPVLGVWRRF